MDSARYPENHVFRFEPESGPIEESWALFVLLRNLWPNMLTEPFQVGPRKT